MAIYFLDSSAVIKRYVNEQGSAWVRQITDPAAGHALYIAAITPGRGDIGDLPAAKSRHCPPIRCDDSGPRFSF